MKEKKGLKLEELRVQSFVTRKKQSTVKGGVSILSCGPPSCAPACGPTNGVVICKQDTATGC